MVIVITCLRVLRQQGKSITCGHVYVPKSGDQEGSGIAGSAQYLEYPAVKAFDVYAPRRLCEKNETCVKVRRCVWEISNKTVAICQAYTLALQTYKIEG